VKRSENLQNVIRAVTDNATQLGMTALFGVIIFYLYAIIAFMFFRSAYFSGDWDGVAMCESLLDCFFVTTHQGLLFSGINGEWLEKENHVEANKAKYLARFAFEISFFVIVVIIFLNVVFGIIIDTFAAMRQVTLEKVEDMRNTCFVCSLDRYLIDRNSDLGFDAHIRTEHNMWGYMYYIVYLARKDTTEYTGIESTVAAMIAEENIAWFPLHKAICLDKKDAGELDTQQVLLQEVGTLKNEMAMLQKDLRGISTGQGETMKMVSQLLDGVALQQDETAALRTQMGLLARTS